MHKVKQGKSKNAQAWRHVHDVPQPSDANVSVRGNAQAML